MIPSEMVADARRHLDASDRFFTGEEVMDRLHAAQQELIRSIVKEDPSFYVQRYDLSFVGGTGLYDLPLNSRMGTRIIFAENLASPNKQDIPPAQLRNYLGIESPGIVNLTDHWHFILEGGKVRITPTPNNSVTDAIRLWYVPSHGNMLEGNPSATASTTLDFFTTDADYTTNYGKIDRRNDFYNGMEIRITDGTGVGQIRTLTDYDGANRRITVAAWDTTPDTSSTFAVICPVPEDHHATVSVRAAMVMAVKNRNRQRDLQNIYYGTPNDRGLFYELLGWIQRRQDSRLETVDIVDFGY